MKLAKSILAVMLALVLAIGCMGTVIASASDDATAVSLHFTDGDGNVLSDPDVSYYNTVKEAWAEAMAQCKSSSGSLNNAVITLQEDVNVTGSTALSTSGVGRYQINVTLDLNDHAVYGADNVAEVFNIYSAHSALLNFEVKNGEFRDNTSKTNGVIYVRSNNTNPAVNFTATNVTFTGNSNTSTTYGGVINALSSSANNTGANVNVKLVNCTFDGNTTNGGGGAVRASNLTVSGCTFKDNTAEGKGGAIYAFGTMTQVSLIVDDATSFKGNTAGTSGNDVSFQRSGSVTAANHAKWVSVAGAWYNDDPDHRTVDEEFDFDNFTANDKTFDIRAQELPELTVEGGTYEYDYTLHAPTATLTEGTEEDYTIQYSYDGETWTEEPIGAFHVDDGEVTVYVRAVNNNKPNLVVTADPVTVSVYAHKLTIRSDDATVAYTGGKVGTTAEFTEPNGNSQFYEIGDLYDGENSVLISTCEGETAAGVYSEHFTFEIDPEAAAYWGIQEHDYELTMEYGTLTVMATVTFDARGGKVDPEQQETTGELGKLPTPVREGYAFIGWYYADGTKAAEADVVSKSVTLFAKWAVIVSMDGENYIVEEGTTIGKLQDPAKDGYVFGGWKVNGVAVEDDYVLQPGDVLEPIWKAVSSGANNDKAPDTSDNSSLALWMSVAATSLISLVLLTAIKRRKYAK